MRSPLPIEALVSPSVTYTPNWPSLATTGRSLTGSVPNSRSGPAAAMLRAAPRLNTLGSLKIADAWSSVIVSSCSSESIVRKSLSFTMYGP